MIQFGKREAIRNGWELFKKHWKFFVGVTVVMMAVSVGVGLSTDYGAIISVVAWILQLFLSVGIMRVNLAVVDGGAPVKRLLFPNWKMVVRYVLASMLFGLVVIVGLILLILPGLYVAVRLQFFGLSVADGAGIVAALKNSWRVTKGSVFNLVLYSLLAALVNILGVLFLVIGTLVTTPTTGLSYAWVYRKLTEQGRRESNPH